MYCIVLYCNNNNNNDNNNKLMTDKSDIAL